ncbi:MAG: hypothetical protein AB9866_22565 [Syntrophobacteraceae bacterium]
MKTAGALAALVLALILVSCSVKGGDQLAGNWQKENGTETINFQPGGKVALVSGQATINTTYKVTSPGKLQFDLGILGMGMMQYSVSKEGLTLTDAQGTASRFTRLQAAKPETKPEVKPQAKPEAKPEVKPDTKLEKKPENKPVAEKKS